MRGKIASLLWHLLEGECSNLALDHSHTQQVEGPGGGPWTTGTTAASAAALI